MLDPRIYRTGLGVVVLAALVLAFSLANQQGPLGTDLAPDAFNGQNAFIQMTRLATSYPSRRPGSAGDDDVAAEVQSAFRHYGLQTAITTFSGRTIDGTRSLETVTGVLAGQSSGSIVIVAHRDALSAPATTGLSGTGTLVELARVLSGETHSHTIVLASISGSSGAVGAAQLARSLPGPVDAVIVLGDLAAAHARQPMVVPWSGGLLVAPTALRNTLTSAVGSQAQLHPGGTSIAAELAHLALPATTSEQGPFGVAGDPAVLVSVSGERGAADGEPIAPAQSPAALARLNGFGRAVLQSINALDASGPVLGPSTYALFAGKVVPGWAVKLFVLALIIPVLLCAIDATARARRRGSEILSWMVWVLTGALPFILGLFALLGAKVIGLLAVVPAGPVGAGVVPLDSGGAVALAGVGLAILVGFFALRPLLITVVAGEPRAARRGRHPPGPGAGAALLVVMTATTIAVWVRNPYAGGMMALALHLWMWVADPDIRLLAPVRWLLVVGGLALPLLVILYYALSLGLTPLGVVWNGALLLAGGHIGLAEALLWTIALGCLASVIVLTRRDSPPDRPEEEIQITVRGPVSYAGPGSLGGTESALPKVRR